jgi:hypothetical protein
MHWAYITIHVINWSKKGSATDFSEEEYFTTMKKSFTDGRTGDKAQRHHG